MCSILLYALSLPLTVHSVYVLLVKLGFIYTEWTFKLVEKLLALHVPLYMSTRLGEN